MLKDFCLPIGQNYRNGYLERLEQLERFDLFTGGRKAGDPMRIAREGYPLIFTAVILTLLAFLAGWMPLGIILGLIGSSYCRIFS